MRVNFNIIKINWSAQSIFIDDAFTLTERPQQIEGKDILYQIYGFSPIYGNTLLYIGISKNADRRFNQHLKDLFGRGLDLKLVIGYLESGTTDMLEIAESILINLHKPSYNSEYIKDIYFKAKEKPYLILNKGNRGLLSLECSNIWWFDLDKLENPTS